jgi:c-di-GMP-related signal transduction protein
MKDIKAQSEFWQTVSRNKYTENHSWAHCSKTTENLKKTSREKVHITFKRATVKQAANFSTVVMETGR